MNVTTTKTPKSIARWIATTAAAMSALMLVGVAQAAVDGIAGTAFGLTARAAFTSQPDGASIYSWGYGCTTPPPTTAFRPTKTGGAPAANCPLMQIPGPTLIVTQGVPVTVTLTNNLPNGAGRTSIVFPGLAVTAADGVDGLVTKEANPNGGTVTYSFTPTNPGTYAYYSGTQADLQIEMGLFGSIVVLPDAAHTPPNCKAAGPYSLAKSAYGQADSCYDREYLFQFSEVDSQIHDQVKTQLDACGTGTCPPLAVSMEPYRPNYFLINGRSMPDIMDTSYSASYPNQPYNGNPHMHPGELVLMRVVGQGRWQHPFHFHGNHARVLARDANMLLSSTDGSKLAGPLLFTISTVSGQTVDAIFTWTGQGLNWDPYGLDTTEPPHTGHTCNGRPAFNATGRNKFSNPPAVYDPTSPGFDPTTHEYCLDHGKPIPATPPDPSIVVNGQWYAGTPYIGLQAANPTPEAPGTLNQNPQAGYAYMWHSHNEREITTNDVFPGGMMMMLLIDPSSWVIDETL
jgi:FtsP/CotA-like multicopper oxidase with cupredoxin domain